MLLKHTSLKVAFGHGSLRKRIEGMVASWFLDAEEAELCCFTVVLKLLSIDDSPAVRLCITDGTDEFNSKPTTK